mmetsp:Transcript_13705/g.43825  ORF Transcript_13705/g.43825 Transcript_13705/m.43825 type:complete len:218 (-) Transcript_13705:1506-2159(-)
MKKSLTACPESHECRRWPMQLCGNGGARWCVGQQMHQCLYQVLCCHGSKCGAGGQGRHLGGASAPLRWTAWILVPTRQLGASLVLSWSGACCRWWKHRQTSGVAMDRTSRATEWAASLRLQTGPVLEKDPASASSPQPRMQPHPGKIAHEWKCPCVGMGPPPPWKPRPEACVAGPLASQTCASHGPYVTSLGCASTHWHTAAVRLAEWRERTRGNLP